MYYLSFAKNDVYCSQNTVNKCKVSLESINAFLQGVGSMNSLEVVRLDLDDLDDFCECDLNNLQSFLENCHLNNSATARIGEFLNELSCVISEDISELKNNFEIAKQSCFEIIELTSHLHSLIVDTQAILNSCFSDDDGYLLMDDCSYDIFRAYVNSFVQTKIEYCDYLSKYVSNYWVYSFTEVQLFIKNYSDSHLKDRFFALQEFISSDLLENYYSSIKSLGISVDVAIQDQHNKYYNCPILKLSDFELPPNLDEIDESVVFTTPLFDTANSLDDILDMVLEENKHDAVIRGALIGTEFC